jgi:hypothetical protein
LNFDLNAFGTQNSQNHIIYHIIFYLLLNFREYNAHIKQIRYVFSILILSSSTSKIAKTFIILAQILGKIMPISSKYAMYFLIWNSDISNMRNSQNPYYFSLEFYRKK